MMITTRTQDSSQAPTPMAQRSGTDVIMQIRPTHTIPHTLPLEQFTPEMIEQWVARCADMGVTALFWHVNYVGRATFHSDTMSRMTPVTPQHYRDRGIGPGDGAAELFNRIGACLQRFDTLDVALDAANRRGLALYANLDLFDQYFPGLEGRFFDEHPELWLRGRVRRRPTQMYDATMPEPFQRLAYDHEEPSRPGQTWWRGIPSYAEPAVQEYWLGFIRELIQHGVECFTFNFLNHAPFGFGNTWRVIDGDEGPDSFGFNPPVVAEYRRRYGADILAEPFDPEKLRKLHGEFFTAFLQRVRQAIGSNRRLIAGTTVEGVCGYGTDGAQFRMKLDWPRWIDEGIADDLMVYSQTPEPADIERVRREIKDRMSNGRPFVWRELCGTAQSPGCSPEAFAQYRRELNRAGTGVVDGYGFKELARVIHTKSGKA